MRSILVVGALWLSGCSTLIPYVPNASLSRVDAAAAVERAIVSQPRKFAADSVVVSDDYVAYGQGLVTTGSSLGVAAPVMGTGVAIGAGHSTTVSRTMQTRIYFDSLRAAEVWSRRGKFVVLTTNDGQPTQHFYLYTQEMAQRLVDAIYSLRRDWSERRAPRRQTSSP